MAQPDCLVLASGGIESVVLIQKLHSERRRLCGITFDVGAPPSLQQIHYAKKKLFSLASPWEIVDTPGVLRMSAGFVEPEAIIFDEGDTACKVDSYIPVFVATACFYAQIAGIPEVHLGLTKEQERPKTREFLREIGSAMAKYDDKPLVEVKAPFLDITKAEVVKLAASLGVDLQETWSCFEGGMVHCGRCGSCRERKAAFATANVQDRTKYLV